MAGNSEFIAAYARLNERQKEAVDAIDGPVMVIAGPGTGKTNILTLRIANILDKTDIPPEAILALTYTVNAASEMQQRLARLIGPSAYRTAITTFHGLCEQIIRDHGERFADLAGCRVADDVDRRRIMEDLFDHAEYLNKIASFGDDPYYVGPALQAIEELKREGIEAAKLSELIATERIRIGEDPSNMSSRGPTKGQLKADAKMQLERMDRLAELAPLYKDYVSTLAAEKLYDYSDMLTRVRDALEHDETLRLALQEKYQYILVDEHQDTNGVQNRIIELLASFFDHPNLFIVGDEKQAIYRFQGASLDNFHYFKDRFRDVRLIVLNENYRSSQLILDAAHCIKASSEPLRARAGHEKVPITLCEAPSPDAQYFSVGQMIKERLAKGDTPDGIAVLYRTNADGQEIADALAHQGILYSMNAATDLLEDVDIRRLIFILDAVREYGQAGPLYEALHVPWLGVEPLDIYKLTEYCGRDRNPYDVLATRKLMGQAHLAGPDVLYALSRRMAGWHVLARQDDPVRTLETIVQESGCLDALTTHVQGQQKLARLHAIYDLARELVRSNRQATLCDLVDRLRYVREKGIRLNVRSTPLPGRIHLMTAHGSKGLEFDTVFMIDCYDKHWPSAKRSSPLALPDAAYTLRPKTSSTIEADAEERNLFFVALTRARRESIICWPGHDRQGRALLPSRYVELITPTLVRSISEDAFAKGYVEHVPASLAAVPFQNRELSDHEYLKALFFRQGLSATALNNFLECPWKYFYRNLVRIPEASTAPLMYGNAVDRALERFFNKRVLGEPADKAILLALFESSAHEQAFSERQLRLALERGRDSLTGWWEKYRSTWAPESFQQMKISGIAVPGLAEVTLSGKIDKMEILDGRRVRVVDFKTGKPKAKEENYIRQLTFYRALLDRWNNGKYQMHEGVLDFIDPDKKGAYKKYAFAITGEAGDRLMEQIGDVSRQIIELAFWNRTCGDRTCPYCHLRSLMK